MVFQKGESRVLFQSTFYGILLQLMCRLVTFFINIQVVRKTDPSVLGLVNVKLLLYQTTVLTLSREPFRRALSSSTNYREISQTIRWIPLVGLIVAFIFGPIWMFLLAPTPAIAHYRVSLLCFIISTLIDQCAESSWYILRIGGNIKCNILMDALSNVARAVFVIGVLRVGILDNENAVLLLSLSYLIQSIFGYLLNRLAANCYPNKHLTSQSKSSNVNTLMIFKFFKQTLIKQSLTECERYIMALTTYIPLREQGMYDTITNITSLIPRLLYAPVEESMYVFLSKTLPRSDSISIDESYESKPTHKHGIDMFTYAQRLFAIVGLGLFTFGLALSNDILQIYFGSADKVSNQYLLMIDFSFAYISVISLNGISEAFLFATLSPNQMEYHNKKLVFFSIIYLVLCVITTPIMHAYGFIFAQCVVMMLRILTSIDHIRSYCHRVKVPWSISKSFMPHPLLIAVITLSSAILILDIPIMANLFVPLFTPQITSNVIKRFGDVSLVLFCTGLVFYKLENSLITFFMSCIY